MKAGGVLTSRFSRKLDILAPTGDSAGSACRHVLAGGGLTMPTATGVLVAALVASFLTAGIMTVLALPGAALPVVLALVLLAVCWCLKGIAASWHQPPLEVHEKALLVFALLVGLLRLAPYAYQYAAGVLVAPVTWDDNWHFQELASLVNAERFPPRLNFQPSAYFHFYYVPWLPAAAISSLALTLTGLPMIKLGYALGALGLALGIAWSLIVVLRHFCPPPARIWAIGALIVSGAAIDGLFAIRHLLAMGHPFHSEWWQLGLQVRNSFSALSTALIWVPHHLTGAMAMLLAVLVATKPITLEPREGRAPYIVAGMLIATAAFSSAFAFAGGVIALSPLLWELLGRNTRERLVWLVASAALPALPLAYIYLGADARGGFVIGQAFSSWATLSGSPAMGFAGIVIAFVLMMLEVGWLYVIGRGLDTDTPGAARLRKLAATSALVLASTAVIGFTGSNNWALRATIVPVVLLAAYAGIGLAAPLGETRLDRGIVVKAGAVALGLALVAHLNEVGLLVGRSVQAPAYATETAECKAAILATNREPAARITLPGMMTCKDKYSAYHIERRFDKAAIAPEDRELMGRGFGFLASSGNPTPH